MKNSDSLYWRKKKKMVGLYYGSERIKAIPFLSVFLLALCRVPADGEIGGRIGVESCRI